MWAARRARALAGGELGRPIIVTTTVRFSVAFLRPAFRLSKAPIAGPPPFDEPNAALPLAAPRWPPWSRWPRTGARSFSRTQRRLRVFSRSGQACRIGMESPRWLRRRRTFQPAPRVRVSYARSALDRWRGRCPSARGAGHRQSEAARPALYEAHGSLIAGRGASFPICAHRRDVLNRSEIRWRRSPCRLAATQCVRRGWTSIFRRCGARSPDGLLRQAVGRCNREGRLQWGK